MLRKIALGPYSGDWVSSVVVGWVGYGEQTVRET